MEGLSRADFKKLKQFPFFRGEIVSNSMVPILQIGTKIAVEVNCQTLERFDLIVFLREGQLICHYIWSINKRVEPILIQTRNTLNGLKDFPIGQDEYLGKVISHKLTTWDKIKIFLSLKFRGKRI